MEEEEEVILCVRGCVIGCRRMCVRGCVRGCVMMYVCHRMYLGRRGYT